MTQPKLASFGWPVLEGESCGTSTLSHNRLPDWPDLQTCSAHCILLLAALSLSLSLSRRRQSLGRQTGVQQALTTPTLQDQVGPQLSCIRAAHRVSELVLTLCRPAASDRSSCTGLYS